MALRLHWKNRSYASSLRFSSPPDHHEEYQEKYSSMDVEAKEEVYGRVLEEVKEGLLEDYPNFISSVYGRHQLEWPLGGMKSFVVKLPFRLAGSRVTLIAVDDAGEEIPIERYTSQACFVPEEAEDFVEELTSHLSNHFV